MTHSLNISPLLLPAGSFHRLTRQIEHPQSQISRRQPPAPEHRSLRLEPTQDRVSEGVLLAFAGLTVVPTLIYAFAHLWSLVGGSVLTRAISVFAA